MTFLQSFLSFLEGSRDALRVVLAVFAGMGISVFIGGRLKSTGVYTALSLTLACAQILVFLFCQWDDAFLSFTLAVEGVFFGCLYGVLFTYLLVKEKLRQRRKRKEEERRTLQFTLPDKDNAYLRDRLQVALNATQTNTGRRIEKESVGVRLRYARRMVAQLKGESLSPIERLDVEEMAGTLAMIEKKEKWSGSEIKMVNEIFSYLLKLSAKYEVAV